MEPHVTGPTTPITEELSPLVAARPLRQYVGRHNRQAVLLAFFSLVAAAILWAVIYGFAYWFALFTLTIVKSFDPKTMSQVTDANLVDPRFPLWFGAGAVGYLLVATLIRRLFRVERARDAGWYLVWVVLELFLAVPNVTFSIWGNLRAVTSLKKHELVDAWYLLQRMNQEQGRLSLTGLCLVIDDEEVLNRILFTLQMIGLVGIRENSQGWFLYLQGQDVRKLLARGVT